MYLYRGHTGIRSILGEIGCGRMKLRENELYRLHTHDGCGRMKPRVAAWHSQPLRDDVIEVSPLHLRISTAGADFFARVVIPRQYVHGPLRDNTYSRCTSYILTASARHLSGAYRQVVYPCSHLPAIYVHDEVRDTSVLIGGYLQAGRLRDTSIRSFRIPAAIRKPTTRYIRVGVRVRRIRNDILLLSDTRYQATGAV